MQGEQTNTLATVSITGKDQDGDTQRSASARRDRRHPGLNAATTAPTPSRSRTRRRRAATMKPTAAWVRSTAPSSTTSAGAPTSSIPPPASASVRQLRGRRHGLLGPGRHLQRHEATGAAASLLVNSNGTYTYTLLDNLLLGTRRAGRADQHARDGVDHRQGQGRRHPGGQRAARRDRRHPGAQGRRSGSDTVTVEDEKAPFGNDEADGGVGSVNGTIVDNVSWGADEFDSPPGSASGMTTSRPATRSTGARTARSTARRAGCGGLAAGQQRRHLHLHAARQPAARHSACRASRPTRSRRCRSPARTRTATPRRSACSST